MMRTATPDAVHRNDTRKGLVGFYFLKNRRKAGISLPFLARCAVLGFTVLLKQRSLVWASRRGDRARGLRAALGVRYGWASSRP
jgi:hypothetical protein